MPRRSRSRRRTPARRRSGSLPNARLLLAAGAGVAALVLAPAAEAWWHEHGAEVTSTARWAVPLALAVATAGASAVAILRRKHAVATSARPRPVAPGGRNDGRDLERRFAALLRRDGYLRVLDPDAPSSAGLKVAGAGDRGLDGAGWHPDYGLLIGQCKQYASNVGSKDMQAFLGTCWYVIEVDKRPADVAVFLTTAGFTSEALVLAGKPQLVRGHPRTVIPIDGARLARWEAGTWRPLPLPTRQRVI